jgi:hypothetical protein
MGRLNQMPGGDSSAHAVGVVSRRMHADGNEPPPVPLPNCKFPGVQFEKTMQLNILVRVEYEKDKKETQKKG